MLKIEINKNQPNEPKKFTKLEAAKTPGVYKHTEDTRTIISDGSSLFIIDKPHRLVDITTSPSWGLGNFVKQEGIEIVLTFS